MSRRIPTNLPGSVRKWSGAAPGSLTHFGFKKVNSEAPYPTIRAYKQVNFDIVGSIPTKGFGLCGVTGKHAKSFEDCFCNLYGATELTFEKSKPPNDKTI